MILFHHLWLLHNLTRVCVYMCVLMCLYVNMCMSWKMWSSDINLECQSSTFYRVLTSILLHTASFQGSFYLHLPRCHKIIEIMDAHWLPLSWFLGIWIQSPTDMANLLIKWFIHQEQKNHLFIYLFIALCQWLEDFE